MSARNNLSSFPLPVSVIVLTKNESANIDKCLESVKEFDEVFVVDSHSTDDTVERTKQYPNAHVVPFQWNGDFPKKKQWALDNCPMTHDWVLMLDADEEVTAELRDEIGQVAADPNAKTAYFISYDNYFLGRRLVHGSHSMKLIFFRRGSARFIPQNELIVSTMWEVEGNYQPKIEGDVGQLKHHALHKDCKTLFHYYKRHNRYSDLEAVHRIHLHRIEESYPPVRRFLKRMLRKTPGSGFLYFIHSYLFKLGFLDGRAGLAFALSRLVYFTQIECKVFELKLNPDIMQRHYQDKGVQASETISERA
ncbi:MAG: family 2 glycosyl transferase [Puniceicoccaceae bacterium 5H]|nr:MAG: family 2 glycosyl transferase [Puniceicoccaceae bacterium 5H]